MAATCDNEMKPYTCMEPRLIGNPMPPHHPPILAGLASGIQSVRHHNRPTDSKTMNPLCTAVALLLICSGTLSLQAQQNILLIIADDYGIDSSSLYNMDAAASQPPTPTINVLASSGVLFQNAYASPVCSSTRACMITGRYGFRTGIGAVVGGATGSPALAADEFTLPEAFSQSSSYGLAQFGKWHLAMGANTPLTRGGWTNFAGGLGGGVGDYTDWTKTINGTSTPSNTNYATSDVVDDAVDWIQARGTNTWFAWVAFNAPHTPFHKPPNELHSYDALSGTQMDINQDPRLYYEAMVEAMDTEMARLLGAVDLTNTHVIFVGDNGTPGQVLQAPFPSGRAKGSLYEGGIHVPMIVSGPAVTNPGRTNNTPVHVVDLFSTILELAGVDVEATLPEGTTIDSRSFMSALNDDPVVSQDVYAEFFGDNFSNGTTGRTLRNGQFKLIQFTDGTEEFFDLSADPHEGINLLADAMDATQLANYHSLTFKLAGYQEALAQPVVTGVSVSGGAFTLTVSGESDLVYTLWETTTFNDLDWTPVTNAITLSISPTEVSITDPGGGAARRFYRVVGEMP